MFSDEFTTTQLLQKVILQRNETVDVNEKISSTSRIIPTLPSALTPGYVTLPCLIQGLSEQLQLAQGRLSLVDASQLLSVDVIHIETAARELCRIENDRVELLVEDNVLSTLVTSEYIEKCLFDVELLAQMNGGKVLVSDAASHIQIPVSKLLQLLTSNSSTLKLAKKRKVIVTTAYERCQKHKVKGAFLAITVPTFVDDNFISSAFNYDPELEDTLQLLKEMCESSILPGELRISSLALSSTSDGKLSNIEYSTTTEDHKNVNKEQCIAFSGTAASTIDILYVPKIHLALQRQTVDQLFKANGYIKKSELDHLAVSKGKMLEFVLQSFPNAIALPNSIIDPDIILTLAESVISEADQLRSFVDIRLSSSLPECIVSNHEDMEEILKTHLTVGEGSSIIYYENDVFYFSSGMIQDILKNIIPPLAQQFSKVRAEQIFKEDALAGRKPSAKTRKKQKKYFLLNTKNDNPMETIEVFPLPYLVANIYSTYPELASSSAADGDFYQELRDQIDTTSDSTQRNMVEVVPLCNWDEDNGRNNYGIISEFCRTCLMDHSIRLCGDGVSKYLEKIRYRSEAHGVLNNKMLEDPYFTLYSLDETFEKRFTPLCYNVQIFSKLSKSMDKSNELRTTLERLFLRTVGADFSYRLTEYCLLKYIMDYDNNATKFSFTLEECTEMQPETAPVIPYCCRPLDQAIRHFPEVFLSCTTNSETVNPLEALSEELPSSVGVELARLWTYCGGECYDGGEVTVKDKVYVRSGNMEKFFSHIEETCLQICGIPFKVIDKKSEKNVLALRYRALSELLDDGAVLSDKEILEIAVILLLQQTTSLAAAGVSDVSILTQVLFSLAENVLPPEVVKTLIDARMLVEDNVLFSDSLKQRLRRVGLCQNIGRYKDDA